MEQVPDRKEKENVNPVCDICHGGHKTSQHEDLQPKKNTEKTGDDEGQGFEKKETLK